MRSILDLLSPWLPIRAALPTALFLTALTLRLDAQPADKPADSCGDCHRNREFMVTNPKLYAYYQRWQEGVHAEAGLSCADCHGGNPKVADKHASHGPHMAGTDPESSVHFRNVLKTCAGCHADITDGFRKSKHFEHVESRPEQAQGPTCVTCHGSVNAAVVDVNTVEQTCAQCHNTDSKNHPEMGEETRALLYQFLSIHRFYRYVSLKGDPAETKNFLAQIDARIHALSQTWHTFDLAAIRAETQSLLSALKTKRLEIAPKHTPPGSTPPASRTRTVREQR